MRPHFLPDVLASQTPGVWLLRRSTLTDPAVSAPFPPASPWFPGAGPHHQDSVQPRSRDLWRPCLALVPAWLSWWPFPQTTDGGSSALVPSLSHPSGFMRVSLWTQLLRAIGLKPTHWLGSLNPTQGTPTSLPPPRTLQANFLKVQ